MTTNKKNFFIDSIIVVLIGVGILVSLPYLVDSPSSIDNRFTSPLVFPKMIGYLLVILGVIQFLQQIITRRKGSSNSSEEEAGGDWKVLLLGLGTLIAYVILISLAGFFVATVIAVFGLAYFFGRPKWYINLLFSVATSGIVYFAFSEFLNVPLPTSIFL